MQFYDNGIVLVMMQFNHIGIFLSLIQFVIVAGVGPDAILLQLYSIGVDAIQSHWHILVLDAIYHSGMHLP